MTDQEKLRLITALIGESSEPTFVIDMRGRIAGWSAAAARFFGVPSERVLGTSCAALIRGCDAVGGGVVCRFDCPALELIEAGEVTPPQDLTVAVGRHPRARAFVRSFHLAIHDEERRPIGVLHLLDTFPQAADEEDPPIDLPWHEFVPGQFLG